MSEELAGPVVVICAMDSEAVHLRRRLEQPEERSLSVWRRTFGQIGGVPVEIIVSGIGLINAAAATAVRCGGAHGVPTPCAIINYGCAGAHRDDIELGDVVIGERVVHHSSVIVLPGGERKYAGFWTMNGEAGVQLDALPADPTLLDLATRMGSRTLLPAWPSVPHEPRVFSGTVASADVWTQHGAEIRALHDLHGSLCEEMEAAAIAQVAATYGVPFLAVKDISNNELVTASTLDQDGALTLSHVRKDIGLRAAMVVEATIATLVS